MPVYRIQSLSPAELRINAINYIDANIETEYPNTELDELQEERQLCYIVG